MKHFSGDPSLFNLSAWPLLADDMRQISELPKISIVTPNYNYAATLERTLCSVLYQKYPNLEYIVIDGGSTDDSQQIIERYENQLAYWESRPDGGQYAAINKGFNKASGEIFAWLNSDDIYLPWTLHVVAEIFAQFPEIDWIMGRPSKIQNGVLREVGSTRPYPQEFLQSGLFRGDILGWVQQESTFWRRSLWKKAGHLREDLHYAADFELWMRFAQYTQLVTTPCILGGFWEHKQNRSKENLKAYMQEVDQVTHQLPDLFKKKHQTILRNLQLYQRYKPFTGVRRIVRKWNNIENYQSPVLAWNFITSCFEKTNMPFCDY
jgi:glycosyltransferase involved in cell wall biosynthesis